MARLKGSPVYVVPLFLGLEVRGLKVRVGIDDDWRGFWLLVEVGKR